MTLPLPMSSVPASTLRIRRSGALLFVGVGALTAVFLRELRFAEASGASTLAGLLGIHPGRLNATVWVQTPDHWPAGINIVNGCSVGLLIIPLALVTGLMLVTGRVRTRSAVGAFLAVAFLVTALNQIRYVITLFAIHRWGFEEGYGQTHVLVGSLVSSVGIVLATATMTIVLLRMSDGDRRG